MPKSEKKKSDSAPKQGKKMFGQRLPKFAIWEMQCFWRICFFSSRPTAHNEGNKNAKKKPRLRGRGAAAKDSREGEVEANSSEKKLRGSSGLKGEGVVRKKTKRQKRRKKEWGD